MQKKILREAGRYTKQNARQRNWRKVVRVLAGCVVFCTTYALILPAITMENRAYCGIEEHTHTESCYVQSSSPRELICSLPEVVQHVHDDSCYAPVESVSDVHTHMDDCYAMEKGGQICQIPETAGHAHNEACYAAEAALACQIAETAGHIHTETCYVAETVLTCQLEETEEHTHSESCYTEQQTQTCGMEERAAHAHDGSCYETPVICGQAEAEAHTHGDACSEQNTVLICELEEASMPEPELICTIPETEVHVHADGCFGEAGEQLLTCGIEESEAHAHSALCYGEWEMICAVEEHTHELACYSNPEADVENAEIWKRTFANVKLTDVWADNVVAIAESQLGYTESTNNYLVREDGATLGYTRYGDWYGLPYGDWCAMFASFCIHYAGVEDMPLSAGCTTWIAALSEPEVDLYRTAAQYDPKPGDLIFFDWDEDGLSDHVGLVSELIPAEGAEPAKIRTIEGNSSNRVQYVTYEVNDPRILGYGMMPEAVAEQQLLPQILTAQIYTDDTYEILAEDPMVITVTGEMPEDASVVAFPVTVDAGDERVLFAYDITIRLPDGTAWSPEDGTVTVDFASEELAEDCSGGSAQVYYLPEEGEPQPVDTVLTDEGLSVTTDHFSVYYGIADVLALADVEANPPATYIANDELQMAILEGKSGTLVTVEEDGTVKLGSDIHFTNSYLPDDNWAENAKFTRDANTQVITYSNTTGEQNIKDFIYRNNSYETDARNIVRNYDVSARIQASDFESTFDDTIRFGVTPWYRDDTNYLLVAPQWRVTADGAVFDGVMLYGLFNNSPLKVFSTNEAGESVYSEIEGYTQIGEEPGDTSISPFYEYTLVVRRQDSEERHKVWPEVPAYFILSYTLYNNTTNTTVSTGAIQIEGHLWMDIDGDVGVYAVSPGQVEFRAVSTTASGKNINAPLFQIDEPLTIDLNGHTITQPSDQTLFGISADGDLTIRDSGSAEVVKAEETLFYDVMTSVVTDSSIGATDEETENRTVAYSSVDEVIMSGGSINANGSTKPVFEVKNGGSLTIEGGKIDGGKMRAVYAENSTVTINDGYISNFELSGLNGGAIYIDNVTLNLNGGVLTGNSANNGGAIYALGANTVINLGSNASDGKTVVISDNEAVVNNGGAIYAEQISAVNICSNDASGNTVVIADNTAVNYGGAIYAGGNTQINICSESGTGNTAVIQSNAAGSGGAIYADGNAKINICSGSGSNNTTVIRDNSASNGGAIFVLGNSSINIGADGSGTGNTTAISKNTATNNGGAIFADGSAQINIYSDNAGENTEGTKDNRAVFSGNTATNNGGAIYVVGSTEINLGAENIDDDAIVVSGNTAVNGGGIHADGSTEIMMHGGYITCNRATGQDYIGNGGGGIFNAGGSMNMTGGYITGNWASRGGGLRTAHQKTSDFYMYGGHISGNVATAAEGGGVCIESGSEAYFLPEDGQKIYITNNETRTNQHWGGGGIFIADGGSALARDMLVTDNKADGYGGGLAGCSTGRIHLFMEHGAAIYGNTAKGEKTSGESSAKNFDRLYAAINEVFNSHGYADYFCALDTEISGGMLGGHPAYWRGSSDGVPVVSNSTGDTLTAAYMMGLTAYPTQAGILAAQTEAAVFINGNSSGTHGGGLLINGYLITGNTQEISQATSLLLKGNKSLIDTNGDPVIPTDENGNPLTDEDGNPIKMEHEKFSFSVTDVSTGAVVATGHNEDDGSIFFSELLSFTEEGTYQYYVTEDKPEDAKISWDTTVYRLTIKVEKEKNDSIQPRLTDFNEITRWQHLIENLKIEKYNGVKSLSEVTEADWVLVDESNPEDYDYAPTEVTISGGATFTNMVIDTTTSVSVTKQWVAAAGATIPDAVTVQLCQNGEVMKEVELSEANNWSHTWADLPVEGNDGTAYTYTVVEKPVDNFIPEYTIRNDIQTGGIFVPMGPGDTIVAGGKYLIVSPDGTKALYRTREHTDKGFDSSDTITVTKLTEPYTLNGTEYTDYYLSDAINPTSIYTAMDRNKAFPILAAGTTSGESCLLIQRYPSDKSQPVETYLKDCNVYTYGSVFTYDSAAGFLVGFEGWEDLELPYTIIYDEAEEKFAAVLSQSTGQDDETSVYTPAKVYKFVQAPPTTQTTVVITNRLADEIKYTLDVTKVSGLDNDVKLGGAKFELRNSDGEALSFVQVSSISAAYEYVSDGSGTTQLVTDHNGKLVLKNLPEGSYTLVEIEAPRGYELAEPVVVTFPADNGYTVSITVEDPPRSYILPDTGGVGTHLYTLSGLLFLVTAAALLYYQIKRGKEERVSS